MRSNGNKSLNEYLDFCSNNQEEPDFGNESMITNDLPVNEHYLCKKCLDFPIIDYCNNETLKYNCKCGYFESIPIKDIFNYITYLDKNKKLNSNLICMLHNEKYIYYCYNCKKNLCTQCYDYCSKHDLIDLIREDGTKKNTNFILDYINAKHSNLIKNRNIIEDGKENSDFLYNIQHFKIEENGEIKKSNDDNINNDLIQKK